MLHAVILGIDRYADDRIKDLRFARADAEALASTLSERVEGDCEITLLLDASATKARIATVMTDELPRRVQPDDDVLVFFAGLGSPEVDLACGEPSIHAITHDTEYSRLAASSINMATEFSAWVRRLPARHVGVMVDASFNGAAGGRSFEGPGLWSGPRMRRLDRVSLNRLAFGTQSAVLAACSDKEAAREEAAYRHGVFTYHLLDLLAHAPGGPLSLASIYVAVATSVRDATMGSQNPTLHAGPSNQPLLRLRSQPAIVAVSA
jgi:uncharacterized caspase-like protein